MFVGDVFGARAGGAGGGLCLCCCSNYLRKGDEGCMIIHKILWSFFPGKIRVGTFAKKKSPKRDLNQQ